MGCFKPLPAVQSENGQVVFQTTNKGMYEGQRFKPTGSGRELLIPCGQCIGCRLDRARGWSLRICNEASLYENNCFITLTYNAENLPPDCGLRKKHFQQFMHRLRKFCLPNKIRFYMCGEYGDKNNRPHYHAIIFNYNFDDWTYLFDSPSGSPIFTSPKLERVWNKGFVTVGSVTAESAGYVARYCVKKVTGKAVDKINEETGLKPYERIDSFTGEIVPVWPEYSTMSRGGRHGRGIGYDFISKFTSDIYPKDYTTVNGVRFKPPRYYDKYLMDIDPDMYDDIKVGRDLSHYLSDESSVSRLSARQKVKEAQNFQLKRNL